MKKLIIFGNGEFASIAKYYFSERKIESFCIDDKFLKEKNFEGLPLIGHSELLKIDKNEYDIFVALSYKKMNEVRKKKYLELKTLGYKFASFIHNSSYVSDFAKIGENCFILENQTIQRNVQIGNNVFMWSSNHIGHNSKVGDHNYISSHVIISGNCEIGNSCFFGVNSSVKDFTKIGNSCLISMGADIKSDLKQNSVALTKQNYDLINDEKIAEKIKSKI